MPSPGVSPTTRATTTTTTTIKKGQVQSRDENPIRAGPRANPTLFEQRRIYSIVRSP